MAGDGHNPPPLSSAKALGIGMELATAIAGLALIGYFLDRYYATEPYLVMTGVALGVIGGVYNAIRQVMRHEQRPGHNVNGSDSAS